MIQIKIGSSPHDFSVCCRYGIKKQNMLPHLFNKKKLFTGFRESGFMHTINNAAFQLQNITTMKSTENLAP